MRPIRTHMQRAVFHIPAKLFWRTLQMKHSQCQHVRIGICAVSLTVLACVLIRCDQSEHVPASLETIIARDNSTWERVNVPGFGSDANMAVVAMQEYNGRLYALVRNDFQGVEVWRTSGVSWEQVLFPGLQTNGIYANSMVNTHMGDMLVFKDKLYVGFSSGIQGNFLKSSGCEVWRYDGSRWEPVISDRKDREEWGVITGIEGCEKDDGDTTALIIDSTKRWEVNRWAGGVLQIMSGTGKFRRFDIVGNTDHALTVQQNEIAGEQGTEYTICEKKHYKNPFPPHEYDLGQVRVGDFYEIGTGYDENGFGDYWNKVTTKMTVFEGSLYVTTALNYDYGGQVWRTEDGDTWTVTQPSRSLGLFHEENGYIDNKKPVTRGVPSLSVCGVSGSEVLYAGTLGSTGNLGSCARIAKLTGSGWKLIVDGGVDSNDNGTNENGFGDGLSCDMNNGNFNVWSLACFNGKLFAGIQSLAGARVLYTPDGSSEDGSWFYSVGGDSQLPEGFDGIINGAAEALDSPIYQNIALNLFPFGDVMYAGVISLYMPEFGATEEFLTGSHIWKTRDGISWNPVTTDGLGDAYVLTFEAFATFKGMLYVAGSRAANTVGGGLGGAKIFRLVGE